MKKIAVLSTIFMSMIGALIYPGATFAATKGAVKKTPIVVPSVKKVVKKKVPAKPIKKKFKPGEEWRGLIGVTGLSKKLTTYRDTKEAEEEARERAIVADILAKKGLPLPTKSSTKS